jgi:hypothetical protein
MKYFDNCTFAAVNLATNSSLEQPLIIKSIYSTQILNIN